MRKIIYTTTDGGVAVVTPIRNTVPLLEDLSDAEIEQRAWDKLPTAAIDPQFVEVDQLPVDRTFRAAWVLNSGVVKHDMVKVRSLAHQHRRTLRNAEFKPYDDAIAKQIPGNDAVAAEAARAVIRVKYATMQSAIDAAQDVDTVKAALL